MIFYSIRVCQTVPIELTDFLFHRQNEVFSYELSLCAAMTTNERKKHQIIVLDEEKKILTKSGFLPSLQ